MDAGGLVQDPGSSCVVKACPCPPRMHVYTHGLSLRQGPSVPQTALDKEKLSPLPPWGLGTALAHRPHAQRRVGQACCLLPMTLGGQVPSRIQ